MPGGVTELKAGGINAIGRMVGVLGDEWNLLIIQQSLLGARRYSHFMARLPISNSVLTNRLAALVGEGLLARRVHQFARGRTEYLTTARSRSLWPVLLAIWEWERAWVLERAEQLPAMRHEDCGQCFAPLLRCRHCHGAASGADIAFAPGPSGQWSRSAPTATTRRRSESAVGTGQAGLFPETMSVLGNRWSAALLLAGFLGTTRFTDFQNQLSVPPSLLAERLQTFCGIGVLMSVAPTDRQERGAYRLTEKGRAFSTVLVAALQWAQRWFTAPEGAALVLTHRGCGAELAAELACDRCGERLSGARVFVSQAEVAEIP